MAYILNLIFVEVITTESLRKYKVAMYGRGYNIMVPFSRVSVKSNHVPNAR
jgi:hypothetical protein